MNEDITLAQQVERAVTSMKNLSKTLRKHAECIAKLTLTIDALGKQLPKQEKT